MKINSDSNYSAESEYITGRGYQLWEGQICIQLIKERFYTGYGRVSVLQLYPYAFPFHCGRIYWQHSTINSYHSIEKLQGNRELDK